MSTDQWEGEKAMTLYIRLTNVGVEVSLNNINISSIGRDVKMVNIIK